MRAMRSLPAALLLAGMGGLASGPAAAYEAIHFDEVATVGQPVPGRVLLYVGFVDEPIVDASGSVAFTARVSGPGITSTNDHVVMGPGAAGGLAVIVQEGTPSPRPGIDFAWPFVPFLDGSGRVFVSDFHGLWGTDGAGGLAAIALAGDPAPGTGATFLSVTTRGIVGGDAIFSAPLAGPGVTALDDQSLWRAREGTLELLAREGDPAPGVGPGLFLGPLWDVVVGSGGDAVLGAELVDATEAVVGGALWTLGPMGDLALVAQIGDPAPGAPSGVVFDSLGGVGVPDFQNPRPAIDAAGRVAFGARLAGPGVDGSNDHALFGPGESGQLTMRVRAGEMLPNPLDLDLGDFVGLHLDDAGGLVFGSDSQTIAFSAYYRSLPDGTMTRIVMPTDEIPDRDVGGEVFGVGHSRWAGGPGGEYLFSFRTTCSAMCVGLHLATPDAPLMTVARTGDAAELQPGQLSTIHSHSYAVDGRGEGAGRAGRSSLAPDRSVALAIVQPDGTSGIYLVRAARCSDGIDNDGDGLVDWPADPGCADPLDVTERGATYACDNGVDDDGDGYVDFTADLADGGDPACPNAFGSSETSQCQDGIDNDGKPGIDFDGGASLNGGVPLTSADPQCVGRPWWNLERKPGACGLGFETALAVAALLRARRWRRRMR